MDCAQALKSIVTEPASIAAFAYFVQQVIGSFPYLFGLGFCVPGSLPCFLQNRFVGFGLPFHFRFSPGCNLFPALRFRSNPSFRGRVVALIRDECQNREPDCSIAGHGVVEKT